MAEIKAEALDILYDGCHKYMIEVKGYATCASKIDIEAWEQYKALIFRRLESGARSEHKAKSKRKTV